MSSLPSGHVTFMFTDIEGSTLLHQRLGGGYPAVIEAHDRLLTDVIESNGGVVIKSLGDGLFAAFSRSSDAVAAADGIQESVTGNGWPGAVNLRVRIGMHAGSAEPVKGDYIALPVHQAARVCAAAHGGQVLLTDDVLRDVTDARSVALGEHRLKDFPHPVALHQRGAQAFPPLRTPSVTNLPHPASSFVGRADDIAHVASMLTERGRLVTLTGPGGSGKTRLAIEVAAQLASRFTSGAFFVDLHELRDPALVTPAISTVLGAPGDPVEHIGSRELLIVLDNLEQVISVAPTLAGLLETCPNLRMLVTSRERLNVRGEQVVPVVPLGDADAISLFCTRSGIEPARDVLTLCRALDRLPLGIELAAARARMMSVPQILERLAGGSGWLTGTRDALSRQRTLRRTIEWSHDLLDDAEQALFARLSVFVGGFTIEAAEAVADADVDVLTSLVDKSLVGYADGRFALLDTIREFALERLEASGETDAIRQRHAKWFVDLARGSTGSVTERERWLTSASDETANIWAVLDRALHEPVEDVFTLATAYRDVAWGQGQLASLARWFERVLEQDESLSLAVRASALRSYGSALMFSNRFDEAERALVESVVLHRTFGDEWGEAAALNTLASLPSRRGRRAELRQRALEIYRRHGDEYGVGGVLHNIGEDRRDEGDIDGAIDALEESIAIKKRFGDRRGVMSSVHSLGDLWLDKGDAERARDSYLRALRQARELGYDLSQAYCVAGLGCVAALEGDTAQAGRLWRVAEEIERRTGQAMLAFERGRYEQVLSRLVTDEHYAREIDNAVGASPEAVIDELLG